MLYVRGCWNEELDSQTVLKYSPGRDCWDHLPSPPVLEFTVAILGDQLLVVGGVDKATSALTNTILAFNESSQQWVQSYTAMPVPLANPAVIGYQNYLILAGGYNVKNGLDTGVNILEITSNKWIMVQSLPSGDRYQTVLIQDTIYLVGEQNRYLLRAHVPSLIQGRSDVWESLSKAPFYRMSPVSIGNNLVAVCNGNERRPSNLELRPGIHLYNPNKDQWIRICNLPPDLARKECNCAITSGMLVVLGNAGSVIAVTCATVKY